MKDPAKIELQVFSKLFIALAMLMACALFSTPVIVNTLSSKASIAKFGKIPMPGAEEEEVKEAKSLPGHTVSKITVHVLHQSVAVLHGPCALQLLKHGEVPDPPPWG